MGLRDIPYKPLYIIPRDNYVDEVLIRSLKHATSVDCMFGFFSSAALRSIAPGLAEYLSRDAEPMRLMVSPNISTDDVAALREGVSTPADVIEIRLKELLGEARISASALVKHTLTCLAYMLANRRLEFRVAWLCDGSLFHPKVWFFREANDTVMAHGSSNFTDAGLGKNLEQISITMSWEGARSEEAIATLAGEHEALWNGARDYVYTLDLPIAIENELIREYKPGQAPTIDDFKRAWEEDVKTIEKLAFESVSIQGAPMMELTTPSYLDLYNGPFSHQGKAITAWESSGAPWLPSYGHGFRKNHYCAGSGLQASK